MNGCVSGKAHSTPTMDDKAEKTVWREIMKGLHVLLNVHSQASERSGVACSWCSPGREAREEVSILNAL